MGLTKRLGVAVRADAEGLTLHLSTKEKAPAVLPLNSTPAAAVPDHLSPAARLIYATRINESSVKADWDHSTLLNLAGQLVGHVGASRRLADEALELGWEDIVDWVSLSPTEKAWRRAHHAAAQSLVDVLLQQLALLPASGYEDRVRLAVPFSAHIAHAPGEWSGLLDSWVAASLPGAVELRDLCTGNWSSALEAASTLLGGDSPLAGEWRSIRSELAAATVLTSAPRGDSPRWAAAVAYGRGMTGHSFDHEAGSVLALPTSLLDDLVDKGGLTADAQLDDLTGPSRDHVLARVRPIALDDNQLRAIGHEVELARRFMVRKDRSRLFGLDTSPGVVHYQALLDVAEGGRPDAQRLREEAFRALTLPASVTDALRAGETHTLPAELVEDPTLWPLFADLAREGVLQPGEGTSDNSRRLAWWIELHRIQGLVWSGAHAEAAARGRRLAADSSDERIQDEALNLAGYSLTMTGHAGEALVLLEEALQGLYSENLLVNASLVAAHADPSTAINMLVRIVDGAPSPELRLAALRQALDVWNAMDEPFPVQLTQPMGLVLSGDLDDETFLKLGGTAVKHVPQVIIDLPDPGGSRGQMLRMLRAWAKLGKGFVLHDVATEYVELFRINGNLPWLVADFRDAVDYVRNGVFADFGEAMGCAEFIDVVLMKNQELFELNELFLLAPQAGAHFSADLHKSDSCLSEEAFAKFFFRPIEQFMIEKYVFNDHLQGLFADNMSRCLGLSTFDYMSVMRSDQAGAYNATSQRANWDSENFYALRVEMRRILDAAQGAWLHIDRCLDRLNRLGDTPEIQDRLRLINESYHEWRNEVARLRGNL